MTDAIKEARELLEKAGFQEFNNKAYFILQRLTNKAATLQRENERLREALNAIHLLTIVQPNVMRAGDIARVCQSALNQKEE